MEVVTEATSAAIAAATSAVLVYPLDTILVRYQASSRRKVTDPYTAAFHFNSGHKELAKIILELLREQSPGSHEPSPTKRTASEQRARDSFTSPEDVVVHIAETLRKLYKGVGVKVFEAVVRNFVYFIWYKLLKETYDRRGGQQTVASRLFLATAAAVINQCFTAPLEVISTNVQTTGLNYRAVIRKIFQQQGFRGFYRGFAASLILCSNPAITNACFDRLKLLLQVVVAAQARRNADPILDEETPLDSNQHLLPITPAQAFCLGALSKALATVVTSFCMYSVLGRRLDLGPSAQTLAEAVHLKDFPADEGESSGAGSRGLSSVGSSPTTVGPEERRGLPSLLSSPGSSLSFSFSSARPLGTSASFSTLTSHPTQERTEDTSFAGEEGLLAGEEGLLAGEEARLPGMCEDEERGTRTAHDRPQHETDPLVTVFVDTNDMLKAASFCLADKQESPGVGEDRAYHMFDSRGDAMLSNGDEVLGPHAVPVERAAGVIAFMVSTLAQEGLPGLYRGLTLQLCKTLIAAAILYMVKERISAETHQTLERAWRLFRKKNGSS
ncbi:carrier superfamily protein [Toxoplasma gondii ME49]|uniref:Mitochondrial carrier superfamily protein n=3 Tax=Toxoplasma gondii TaxID=5811 RepID=A0A086JHE9_TOXGO|nr:carrier superfamily protein [Toxoplasma gondii ME49]EPT26718.1 carrier superfamily protein [Toxoplasma gondii ME49]KFG31567.1 mitochondrial carrier superfamily protein [Toxoplasma gondii GAB2-2007-GAL-DOM2]|eukprot:XP_018635818.1 carrier superfamily protein [Toxoplasma gondii ME49]